MLKSYFKLKFYNYEKNDCTDVCSCFDHDLLLYCVKNSNYT